MEIENKVPNRRARNQARKTKKQQQNNNAGNAIRRRGATYQQTKPNQNANNNVITQPRRIRRLENINRGTQKMRIPDLSYKTMSQCAMDYALALSNPWSPDLSKAPCVPDAICLPSYKFGPIVKGTFEIGNDSVGYVGICSYGMIQNDKACGLKTNSSFTNTVYDQNINGSSVLALYSNSPYSNADFGTGSKQYRVVGCGLKVRYVGSNFNKSGRMLFLREPNNGNIQNALTDEQINAYRETVTVKTDNKWHCVTYTPATSTDLGYIKPDLFPVIFQYINLLCFCTGKPGEIYEFASQAWYEVVGSNLPQLTRSHVDPIGMGAALQSNTEVTKDGTPESNTSKVMENIGSALKDVTGLSPMGLLQEGVKMIL